MNKLHVYTGKGYNFRHYNCWHHVRCVRNDVGLDTPEFDCVSLDLVDSTFEVAHEKSKGLQQVDQPADYCAVLMKTKRGWHSGIYYDGMVSHCDREARQVRLDTLESINKISLRVEFWR